MNRDFPSRAACLFPGNARVVMPSLVQELNGTIRKTGPRERGDRVDDLSERRLRLPRLVEHLLKSRASSDARERRRSPVLGGWRNHVARFVRDRSERQFS
jgi:hypothetical protein